MSHVHFTNPEVLAGLRREYEQKVERDNAALDELHIERRQLYAEELQWARRHLLLLEKGVVIDAFHRGHLSQTVQEKLLADIDARLLRLESGETDESNGAKTVPGPRRWAQLGEIIWRENIDRNSVARTFAKGIGCGELSQSQHRRRSRACGSGGCGFRKE